MSTKETKDAAKDNSAKDDSTTGDAVTGSSASSQNSPEDTTDASAGGETELSSLVSSIQDNLSNLPDGAADGVVASRFAHDTFEITLSRSAVTSVITLLKETLGYEMLLCISGVDYFDEEFAFRTSDERFEVVYHLLNLHSMRRLRVKVGVPESDPSVASIVELHAGADFMEREVWDMVGVKFEGHPDLRRILMYEELYYCRRSC